MKQTLTFIITVLVLTSCSNDRQLCLVFNNSTGLIEESPVLVNGFQIGEIDRLEFLNDKRTLVTIDLTEEIEIPNDSKFKIEKNSLLGDASINIELGTSQTPVSQKDTIKGTYSVQPTEIEKGIHKVVKNLIEATDSMKIDSLKEEKIKRKKVPNNK